MESVIIEGIMRGMHDLATVVWIGGLIIFSLVFIPAVRNSLGPGNEAKRLAGIFQKRLMMLVVPSIAILIITGIYEARLSPDFSGLFRVGDTYSLLLAIKHGFVAAMLVLAASRQIIISKAQKAGAPMPKIAIPMVFANMLLGTTVVLLSGFLCALG
jgi:uncharacterized membrane protein